MMKLIEEAIIYATIMHQGKTRKLHNIPYILHPMEVAQILATLTEDEEIITAGILHDIVEDTDGTMEEIESRFGKRVAALVSSESEPKYPGEDKTATWKKRKEESLLVLQNSKDIGVKMLWLADKLANMRSLHRLWRREGNQMWKGFNQENPVLQAWYYRSIADLSSELQDNDAWKEYKYLVDMIFEGVGNGQS